MQVKGDGPAGGGRQVARARAIARTIRTNRFGVDRLQLEHPVVLGIRHLKANQEDAARGSAQPQGKLTRLLAGVCSRFSSRAQRQPIGLAPDARSIERSYANCIGRIGEQAMGASVFAFVFAFAFWARKARH